MYRNALLILTAITFSILPLHLQAQELSKVAFTDSLMEMKNLLILKFGAEAEKELQDGSSPDGYYRMSYLEIISTLNNQHKDTISTPSLCSCSKIENKIELVNAFGFFGGAANVININLEDSTYFARLGYSGDGAACFKTEMNGAFISDILLFFNNIELTIVSDNDFADKSIIRGRLTGTTVAYFQRGRTFSNSKPTKEIFEKQDFVFSEFECVLQDWTSMAKELELKEKESRKANGKKNE